MLNPPDNKRVDEINPKHPVIILLNISILLWVGFQVTQLKRENQLKADQLRLTFINNWNETPILNLNISKKCQEIEINVDFTIPFQNQQCLCSEEINNQKCSYDQLQSQGCLQIQEFNTQTINNWPFYLRLNTQVPYQLCYQQSNINSYYNQLKENKCLNNSYQNRTQQPISNLQINREYMVNENMLLRDSIKVERNLQDPIVGIQVRPQINNQTLIEIKGERKQFSIIESFQAQEVWRINNIDNLYHPHIYQNYTYYLLVQRYIKLKDKCDCSNQVLNTLDDLADFESEIINILLPQLIFILLVQIIIILILRNQKSINVLQIVFLIVLILEFCNAIILWYIIDYKYDITALQDCFDFFVIDDDFCMKQIIHQITIIILTALQYLFLIIIFIKSSQVVPINQPQSNKSIISSQSINIQLVDKEKTNNCSLNQSFVLK